MDYEKLAELLFPNVTKTPEEIEELYPARDLPEGAKVTRFAPSPTGFVHFGGLFPAVTGERLAHQSGGVFYLRIEDTDAKREVEGAAENLIATLAHYGVTFDEGAISGGDKGSYGPYRQSQRRDIYHVFAKKLVKEGKAYPCFTTEQELEALEQKDKKAEIKNKDWHVDAEKQKQEMLKQREITLDEVKAHLEEGHPFVLRILADGGPEKKTPFTDLIRGKLEIPENDEDFVLLKSDGIPTYHFAHAVDDHLMRTTHIIRGEEWLPSLAKHIMLFKYLGFRMPKYMHIAQLMSLDENGCKKKLSKRDMGANLNDYTKMGYAPECVIEYVMTLLNSNYEEWHTANPSNPYTNFPFNIKKMSISGCLFDFEKLKDVSKNVISKMSSDMVYDYVTEWSKDCDTELYDVLTSDPEKAKRIFAIGRGVPKPRKDFAVWSDVKPYISIFYDELFKPEDEYPDNFDKQDIKAALEAFVLGYDENDDSNAWFDKLKQIADKLGFAPEVKLYKKDPEAYKGHVGDISMFVRVAVTGRMNSPDLYEIMHILGCDSVKARIQDRIRSL